MNCQYSTPVNLGTTELPDWEYSELTCEFSQLELIENATTGAEFYISKTIGYGDILVITFLTLFLVFGILKFLTDFLIPKLVNFKRK